MKERLEKVTAPFEIWMAALPGNGRSRLRYSRRPVVVISGEGHYVSVVPLTGNLTARQFPTQVLLHRGPDRLCRALCDQVMPLEKKCLLRRIGYVDDAFDRFALRRALANHLNLMDLPGMRAEEENIYWPVYAG